MITAKEQQKAAREFAKRWESRGYEKGESNLFWIDLLTHVYGVDNIAEFISFEDQVHLDHTSFIDGYIKSTKVMIEQKSIGKDLRKGIKQSDETFLTPFQQAKRYVTELPLSQHPRWIITCNFSEFLVYDMEKPNGEPEQIFLKDLEKDYYRLQFLVKTGSENLKREMEISLKAGELVGKLYDAILKQYKNPNDPLTLKSLNMLCVRLVFCLYAEDAGIFGQHEMFGQYLAKFPVNEVREKLIKLFEVLDTKPEDRDPYMDDDLAAFPYVNGGLFADERIEIPRFTDEIVDLLIHNASEGFDWSEISPTIFGAVFESTLNPETRRSGGMHYTSIENIHKVIDPLFLDDLKAELAEIAQIKVKKTRDQKLEAFREKLSTLVFLDPACGSGNFLTETYLSLRRLENESISLQYQGQILMGVVINPIRVGISQFYGIEINDFAVTVARSALWIAESQMLHETEELINQNIEFLPLKSYPNITEGNALRIDWESVVPKEKLTYIMGNPPFVGHRVRCKKQAEDMEIMSCVPKYGKIDYVGAWYYKSSIIMQNSDIECSFVSTNSICQGESVGTLWKYLIENLNLEIQFAYKTFNWSSEAKEKAHVHCIIIGFKCKHTDTNKFLFDNGMCNEVTHINPYLQNAPDVFLPSRGNNVLSGFPKMIKGNEATDGKNFSLTEEEYQDIVCKYPKARKFLKLYIGSDEYINNKKRYCIWLLGISPSEYRNIPPIMERIEKVRNFRANNVTKAVHKLADYPTIFAQIRQPTSNFLVLPGVSSQRRKYIPMGFMNCDVIPNSKLNIIPNATLYLFGVLESNVHMAWMRVVTGRLKSDYEYYPSVYNNFPFCDPTPEQKAKIEQTAQAILDARAKYPDSSLADLYDETTMPPELRKTHQANDKAVMKAYGFSLKMTESECVAELMRMYQRLTEKQ